MNQTGAGRGSVKRRQDTDWASRITLTRGKEAGGKPPPLQEPENHPTPKPIHEIGTGKMWAEKGIWMGKMPYRENLKTYSARAGRPFRIGEKFLEKMPGPKSGTEEDSGKPKKKVEAASHRGTNKKKKANSVRKKAEGPNISGFRGGGQKTSRQRMKPLRKGKNKEEKLKKTSPRHKGGTKSETAPEKERGGKTNQTKDGEETLGS